MQLYGADVIRPNHHYAVHTADFIYDYGPLYGFWTFLFERLNKVLKSYNTNNHGGGELEVTFFREFQRTSVVSRAVSGLKCVLIVINSDSNSDSFSRHQIPTMIISVSVPR